MNSVKIAPSVLQVELHPELTQKKLIEFCRINGIQMTAFSSLGSSSYVELEGATSGDSLFESSIIKRLSQKYEKSPARILLRWAVQHGIAVIPKTVKVERLKENGDVFDWNLTK